MQFSQLHISPSIIRALEHEGYVEPTPIQVQAIPPVLEGRDLLGCAQTGTGKTAAFAVPVIQLLSADKSAAAGKRRIRALVLTPTRELAVQIDESFRTYGRNADLRYLVVYGGVSQKPSEAQLKIGVDVLVATPGRLNDLIGQGLVDLQYLKIFILDEADRMLDMGFIHDVKKIIAKTPEKKQTLLFSATIPPEISKMADSLLVNPVKISVTPDQPTVEAVEQYVYFTDRENKPALLAHLLKNSDIESALVFSRTKHGADKIVRLLNREFIQAESIHGNKSQNARQTALNNFKNRTTRVLVATDIAARGIDIDELSHVFNYDLPEVPETYVHRIGRTARAGLGGTAIAFCDYDEKPLLAAIEKLIGKKVEVVEDHPYPMLIHTLRPRPQQQGRRRPTGDSMPPNRKPAAPAAQPAKKSAEPPFEWPNRPQRTSNPRAFGNRSARRPAGHKKDSYR